MLSKKRKIMKSLVKLVIAVFILSFTISVPASNIVLADDLDPGAPSAVGIQPDAYADNDDGDYKLDTEDSGTYDGSDFAPSPPFDSEDISVTIAGDYVSWECNSDEYVVT